MCVLVWPIVVTHLLGSNKYCRAKLQTQARLKSVPLGLLTETLGKEAPILLGLPCLRDVCLDSLAAN